MILTALKKYGMIMTDNGAPMSLSGVPDSRWNDNHLFPELKKVTASDFEVVLMSPVYTPSNIPKGPKPVISHFAASTSGGPGQPVTLSWNVSYGEYYIVSPMPGKIRGTSTVVSPTVTTTYTLYATNPYGRTTAPVTVPVP